MPTTPLPPSPPPSTPSLALLTPKPPADMPLPPTPFEAMLAGDATGLSHRKGDLHSNAASLLRKMIITGALAPGERLNERELCERLKVSRTPVREAIKTLTQEGLLNSLPNRSPVVAPLDAAHTSALIEVVAAIEGLAGELAAARVCDAEVAELGILHYTMLKHHAHDELPGYFEANRAFHRRIVEYAGNPVLLRVWDLLALQVDRARYASNLWPTRWQKATTEHAAILDLLAARDAAGVSASMRQHVRNGLSLVVASLERGGEPGQPGERGESAEPGEPGQQKPVRPDRRKSKLDLPGSCMQDFSKAGGDE